METKSQTVKGISLVPPASNGFRGPLKLTLSAYRRPEDAVRLTDADPTKLIHDKYELCGALGHGASSTVRLAYRRSDGRSVAVKAIAKHDALGLWNETNRRRRGASGVQPRLDEVDILTALGGVCPDVVQLLDVYETCHEVQLVLEYCEGGDLFDCINKRRQQSDLIRGSFSEPETATVAKTLLDVLHTLHSRNIVHRDIKPENILLVHQDPGEDSQLGPVKLTDFGLARLLHGGDGSSSVNSVGSEEHLPVKQRSRAYSCVGSNYYAAPEVHWGAGYDTPVDIYSLGVTLYVMLCGTPPLTTSFFKSEDADLTDEDISCIASVSDQSAQSSHGSSGLFSSQSKLSHLAQDFISKMVHPDPEKRITASEGLKHEWIAKHSVHEDTQAMTCVTPKSKLPVSSSRNSLLNSRTLSFAEAQSFLQVGPALPFVPSSKSPATKILEVGPIQTPQLSKPASPDCNPNAATSLALANVCSKLAPLVNEQRLRKHRIQHHASPHVDGIRVKKRARSGGRDDEWSKKRRGSCEKMEKMVCFDAAQRGHLSPNSCVSCRIGRRFNNSGIAPMGPFLPKSPA